jgi:hypothetical protein
LPKKDEASTPDGNGQCQRQFPQAPPGRKPSASPVVRFPGWPLLTSYIILGTGMAETEERRGEIRRKIDQVSLEEFARREDLLACVKKEELQDIIKGAVKDALNAYQHKCVLNLDSEQIRQVGNLFNAIKEIGDGQLEHGVEIIRDNHKLISRYVTVTGKIGTSVITTVVFIILAFFGSSVVIGVVEKLKGVIKD